MTLKVFLLCSAILNLVSSSSYVLILVQLFSNKQKIFKKTPQKCCVVCKIIDKNWGYLKFIQYYKLYSQKLNFSFVHHSFSLLFLDHSYRTFKARWMPNHSQQGRRMVRKFEGTNCNHKIYEILASNSAKIRGEGEKLPPLVFPVLTTLLRWCGVKWAHNKLYDYNTASTRNLSLTPLWELLNSFLVSMC